MRKKIDVFLTFCSADSLCRMLELLLPTRAVNHINILVPENTSAEDVFLGNCASLSESCSLLTISNQASSETIMTIASKAEADYVLLTTKAVEIAFGQSALDRFVRVAADADAALVYSDHWTLCDGVRQQHPVIDYQEGSIRDDFDFGDILLIKTELLRKYVAEMMGEGGTPVVGYRYAGLYDLRLFLSREGNIFHINEYLYTTVKTSDAARKPAVADNMRNCKSSDKDNEPKAPQKTESQFDYVNPANREVQIEMEQAATVHLKAIGAMVETSYYGCPDFTEQDFPVEASVVIPVRNREQTIMDAVKSALAQKANFSYNVIVVDNHSTDKTTELLAAETDERLVHIVPERDDLGIGGCWNVAVNDGRCGRFAVQLDSDDLYSLPQTLQKIVDAFYKQKAAMIVGSYRICDFDLNTLPPGLIDHREWTDENGPNNALRINGLGAPRAFFTPLLRQVQFPNTSYGEDYALGLLFSRRYRIGRVYDELYLCRRWGGNSDSSLTQDKINANNLYKDRLRTLEISARRQMTKGSEDIMNDSTLQRFFNRQLEEWELARQNYRKLVNIQTRELPLDDITLIAQHNPERMRSTGANVDEHVVTERPCFLCEKNRPEEQIRKAVDENFELLVNPYPILPTHFTIPTYSHEPQHIRGNFNLIFDLLTEYPELTVFYNGPKSGASAPDHCHFQAGHGIYTPLQTAWPRLSRSLKTVLKLDDENELALVEGYPCSAFVIKYRKKEAGDHLFNKLYDALPCYSRGDEPMMNILAWRSDEDYLSVVLPRKIHRPICYNLTGDDQYLVSPGALDMAGLLILPREEDFKRITPDKAIAILQEVSLSEKETKTIVDRMTPVVVDEKVERNEEKGEPEVSVGIMSREKISFTLNNPYLAKGELIEGRQEVEFSEGGILWNGNLYRELEFTPKTKDASFSLHDVTIGVNFHWERNETETFNGMLRLVVESDKITAINQLPVERYLASVISSEMKDTASPEFLRAHAVISRSWLLAQMEKRRNINEQNNGFFSFTKKDDEIIRWYDREDHAVFDVCADDHCQRYQGITSAGKKSVVDAIKATRGQILMYDDTICDARFSKCCGGATEEFRYCWEDVDKPYLIAIKDGRGKLSDLRKEEEADKWIRTAPDAFCNTRDVNVLSQVLQDYDRETQDFYRWRVDYTQQEITRLIEENTKETFGQILDLIPLERGRSGRICRLKIVGTEKTLTVGKELEIRRILSDTHLYSSAFVVDKTFAEAVAKGKEKSAARSVAVPTSFTILGAGWGHGVGLCQIGAAMMGEQGFDYDKILLHYYRGAEIKKIYK